MLEEQNLFSGTKIKQEAPLIVQPEADFLNKRTFKDYLIGATIIASVVFMLCFIFFILFVLPIILVVRNWS
ncbi:MAG: hypothetical protein K2O22_01810 [Anaeroplasmataceae bacterium]|nr:hypothetical protein [Anaeroplasmataceae bacterium]